MARQIDLKNLEVKRTELLAKLKQLDTAIAVAKEREAANKAKEIYDALAQRGLLDTNLDALLDAIQKVQPVAPEAVANDAQSNEAEAA